MTMKLKNLLRKNDILSMIKILESMPKEMKMIPLLNLKLKSLSLIYAIILTHIFLLLEILKIKLMILV